MQQGQPLPQPPQSSQTPQPQSPPPQQPAQLPPLPQGPSPIQQYATQGQPLPPMPPPSPQQYQPTAWPQDQQPAPPQQYAGAQPITSYQTAAPQQPPQQTPAPSLRDALAARGVAVDGYETDDALLADLGRSAAERQRMEYLARIGQQAITEQQGQQQHPPQQQQQQAPQQPQQLEWRPEWATLLQRDPDSGLFVPKPGNELVAGQIAQIANQREAVRRENAERLMDDPASFVMERGLKDVLEQQRQQIIAELRQQEEDRKVYEQVTTWQREIDPLLFQRDQAGKTVVNPLTGQPVLTPLGHQVSQQRQQFSSWFQSVYQVEPDDALVMQVVRPIVDAHRQQQQPAGQQQAPPPQQPYDPARNEEMKHQMTVASLAQQAMYAPNHNGTVAAAAMNSTLPQNSQASFAQTLRDAAIQQGIISPDAWQ